jgi:hypothetical protein
VWSSTSTIHTSSYSGRIMLDLVMNTDSWSAVLHFANFICEVAGGCAVEAGERGR